MSKIHNLYPKGNGKVIIKDGWTSTKEKLPPWPIDPISMYVVKIQPFDMSRSVYAVALYSQDENGLAVWEIRNKLEDSWYELYRDSVTHWMPLLEVKNAN